jgi:hypothetical protein
MEDQRSACAPVREIDKTTIIDDSIRDDRKGPNEERIRLTLGL